MGAAVSLRDKLTKGQTAGIVQPKLSHPLHVILVTTVSVPSAEVIPYWKFLSYKRELEAPIVLFQENKQITFTRECCGTVTVHVTQ